MRLRSIALFGAGLLLLNGCAAYTNMTRKDDCDKVIKAYSRMLRWQEPEKAAMAFVDHTQRDSFAKGAESMRRRNLNMADMRILASECKAERKSAEATVEFDYYVLPDNRLKTVTDRQKWIFREEDDKRPELGEGWKLLSPFPEFK